MELIESIEKSALFYSTGVMILAGAVVVILGLMIWLGGLRWAKIISIVTGAGVGTLCGVFFTTREPIAICLFALISGLVALFFEKVSMVLICAVLISTVTMACLVISGETSQWHSLDIQITESINAQKTLQVAWQQVQLIAEQFRGNISKCNVYSYLAAGAIGLITCGIGIPLTRFIAALGASLAGVLLIFAGMIILLLNKGSRPLSIVANNLSFLIMSVTVMLAFGVIIQMLMCPNKKKQKKKGVDGD